MAASGGHWVKGSFQPAGGGASGGAEAYKVTNETITVDEDLYTAEELGTILGMIADEARDSRDRRDEEISEFVDGMSPAQMADMLEQDYGWEDAGDMTTLVMRDSLFSAIADEADSDFGIISDMVIPTNWESNTPRASKEETVNYLREEDLLY